MSEPSAKLSVLTGKDFACVKIAGWAKFDSSIDFRVLVNELLQRGCPLFVLELSECMLMDSTFLGVLTGFGLRTSQARKDGGGPVIELLNPNTRIVGQLEELGVLHLFRVSQGTLCAPDGTESRVHEHIASPKEEVQRACLEAHRTLMEANPQNVPKFKDLTQFLAEDLKKGKSG
ncbi:MAG: hypothetical protein C5B50_21380 [Verrucomicrobia bacterium]|nr:MAG: hypothetical protein C5B50_21380 [Verrucomicrobiota bacterium]